MQLQIEMVQVVAVYQDILIIQVQLMYVIFVQIMLSIVLHVRMIAQNQKEFDVIVVEPIEPYIMIYVSAKI